MNRKQKSIIVFNTLLSLFLLVLAVNIRPWWASAVFTVLLGGSLAWYLYMIYHLKHASRKEKERIRKQTQASHYYYDKWYNPADATRMENDAAKIKKKSRYSNGKHSARNH